VENKDSNKYLSQGLCSGGIFCRRELKSLLIGSLSMFLIITPSRFFQLFLLLCACVDHFLGFTKK